MDDREVYLNSKRWFTRWYAHTCSSVSENSNLHICSADFGGQCNKY